MLQLQRSSTGKLVLVLTLIMGAFVLNATLTAQGWPTPASPNPTTQPYRPYSAAPQRLTSASNPYKSKPPVSPYVNLARGGGSSPGLQYYGLVRPQREMQERFERQQGIVSQLSRNQNGANQTAPQVGATGHETFFLNLRDYYPGFPR